jgi:hypothetical protein
MIYLYNSYRPFSVRYELNFQPTHNLNERQLLSRHSTETNVEVNVLYEEALNYEDASRFTSLLAAL